RAILVMLVRVDDEAPALGAAEARERSTHCGSRANSQELAPCRHARAFLDPLKDCLGRPTCRHRGGHAGPPLRATPPSARRERSSCADASAGSTPARAA